MAVRVLATMAMAVVTPHLYGQSFDPGAENCVDLHLGAWSFEFEPDSLLYAVPPRVVFGQPGGSAAGGPDEMRPLGVPEGGLPSPHELRGWRYVPPDSIRMHWTNGWAGVAATGRLVDDGFVGTARLVTDVIGRAKPEATLVGRVVPCDSPLEYRLSDQRQLLRGFGTVGETGIELGDPIGRTVSLSSKGHDRYQVREALAPPFDGSVDSLVDVSGSGHVSSITLSYAGAEEFERLRDALVQLQGPPTSTEGEAEGRLSWANRTTWVSLRRLEGEPGEGVRVRLSVMERTFR